jgi:uncharacterized protein (TIGR02246 family)
MAKLLHRCVLAIGLTMVGSLLLQSRTEILHQTTASAQQPKAAASTDDDIVKPIIDLAKSYNAKDAKAFALAWTEKAEYVDEDTGERLDGRKAIVDDFAETFAKNANTRVEIDVTKVRRLGESAAAVEGTARVLKPKTPVAQTKFLALLVRQDGNWLIDNIRESRIESDNPNAEFLEPLNWLTGTWISKDGDDEVSMECTEVANGNFLTIRFKVKSKDDTTLEGTTIIGWDAAQKQLRTWVFSSDGSFGEGVIQNSGDRWTIRVAGTLPSGERSAATQIVTRKDDTHFTFESTDRTVGTGALPNGSVITLTKTTGKGD